MRLVVGGISAHEFWRSSHSPIPSELEALPKLANLTEISQRNARFLSKTIAELGRDRGLINLYFSQSALRCVAKHIRTHALSDVSALPSRSFLRVGQNTYIASPELCLAQIAAELPREALLMAGMELCSNYGYGFKDGSLLVPRDPLTTPGRIRSFLSRSGSFRGVDIARDASRWMLGGAASPREAALALILSLPSRLGGYQLEPPKLNYRIDLSMDKCLLAQRGFVVADICWPKSKLCLEYNSDMFHLDNRQSTRDLEKITALQSAGYHVVPISTRQFSDFRALDHIIRSDIYDALGRRARGVSSGVADKRRDLHYRLRELERKNLRKTPLAEQGWWGAVGPDILGYLP